MNKGLAIGISIAIVIGGIGVGYSLFTSQDQTPQDSGSDIAMVDTATATVRNATEQEEPPPRVQVSVEEKLGVIAKP